MVGGAAAIFLHADVRIAESEATFQHGNLSRGVCPVAGYSCTLQAAIGTLYAYGYYLTDQRLTAASALMLGLVHSVCTSVHLAKEGARKAAKHVTLRGEALLPSRCTVDLQLLEEEALAHMECQYVNGGMIMTSGVHSVAPTSLTTLVWPVTAKVPARWHSWWLKRNNIRG